MLKVIELFAGIGAQRKALQKAEIEHEVIAISEIDKYAIQSYNAIHGETPNLGDITKIEKMPKADLWTYSFPCTDISISGRMKGFDKGSNTGSSLLWEVQRLLEVARDNNELPRFLLMENVKNIISKKFMPKFQEWLDFLTELGYKNFYQVLNAKDYGVPQNRERCFMISILNYDGDFKFPEKQELKVKLRDLLEDEVDEKYFLSNKLIDCFTDMKNRNGFIRGLRFRPKGKNEDYAWTITTHAGSRPTDNYIIEPIPAALRGRYESDGKIKQHLEIKDDGNTNTITTVQKDKIPTLKTSINDIAVVVTKDSENYIQWEQKGWFDIECRAYKEDKVSGALNTRGHMKVLTNDVAIRRLTPLECFRLMGFDDDDYQKIKDLKISDTQAYKMAGNSIVVNCLTEIFKKLKEIIENV
ncbi:MAG: Modification methylase BanI [Bacteroidetes bacterium ADurb.Bin041]|nr:MAG: Modification methylase BanI [Bacteroidetes bacterium ADurb.Bin041]